MSVFVVEHVCWFGLQMFHWFTCHRAEHACHMSHVIGWDMHVTCHRLHCMVAKVAQTNQLFAFCFFFNLRQKVGLISPGFYKTLAKGSTFLQTKLVEKKAFDKKAYCKQKL